MSVVHKIWNSVILRVWNGVILRVWNGVIYRIRNFIYGKDSEKVIRQRWEHETGLFQKMMSDDMPQLSAEELECCNKLWSKYPVEYNSDWARFYKAKTGIFDPRFIPNEIQYTVIDEYFNNWKMADTIDDKNYYPLLFHDVNLPNTVLHIIEDSCYLGDYTPVDIDAAFNELKKYDKLIFKKAVSSMGGHNIFVWDSGSDTIEKLREYLDTAVKKKNYVVQEFIKQSAKLSKIHSKAVNSMRIETLLFENEVHFLSAILKMGAGDMKVDNVHWGGCSCGITEDGTLRKLGSDVNGNKIAKHPSGFEFDGFQVPNFKEAKEMVCNLHKRLGRFRFIGWDVAIDENDKPILIEANLRYAAIDFVQWNNGPLYGDLTERVLDEVFHK